MKSEIIYTKFEGTNSKSQVYYSLQFSNGDEYWVKESLACYIKGLELKLDTLETMIKKSLKEL